MSEKKYVTPAGAVTDAALDSDFESAAEFDKVKVGSLGVYYRDGLKTRHIPYSVMERAFIRVQEVNGRMCCGTAKFAYFRLIFIVDGKEIICDRISENEKAMDDALAEISKRAPGGKIGKEQ